MNDKRAKALDKIKADIESFKPKQDDKQLRKAIEIALAVHGLTYNSMAFQAEVVDELAALFTTAQLQLLAELMEQSVYGHLAVPNCTEFVPVSILEHKKQELERGK